MRAKLTTTTFIERSKEIHNNKYDYSKTVYVNARSKVIITCPVHGDFEQIPDAHMHGIGCRKCGRIVSKEKQQCSTETFVEKAKQVHGDKYDYTKANYTGAKDKITIACPIHGDFEQIATNHLSGQGCPLCGIEKQSSGMRMTFSEFSERANKIHNGKFTYHEEKFISYSEKTVITCPIHGDFEQTPALHLTGRGCQKCAIEKKSVDFRFTTEHFIELSKEKYGDKFSYEKTIYKDSQEKIIITCKEHGDFETLPTNHLHGYKFSCPKCAQKYKDYVLNNKSKSEIEVFEFVKSLLPNIEVQQSNREILENMELDIYIPELKIAIEFDGLYWHSEKFTPKHYHFVKTNRCEELGIQIIHIFEDEWFFNPEIVKSRIRNLLHKNTSHLYARRCAMRQLTLEEEKVFYKDNHLQGYTPSKVCYGLIYNNEIVSAMSFGGLRKATGNDVKENHYELLRFCNRNNTSVVGAASKLFKHFLKTYNPAYVLSYADRRYSQGNLYKQLGMECTGVTQPNYFYVIGIKRYHRFNFRKDILISKYGCPQEMTEHEFCLSQNWLRIYDCGSMRFEMYTL